MEAGAGGLSQPSIVLLDQVRGLDTHRILAYLGTLASEQYAPIVEGLMQLLIPENY
ncbi:type II toxin-antitoxin system PemK/MazF family toxin [aff. Roholtiella sp. LEGE 12411]|uniref:type II toxin-antitoxin system PemK/MazF family toxin n=1 Tax=aff. Roholtiella sp. LEGE 12411 TaxID=1828822 RepID=UPI001ABC3DC9